MTITEYEALVASGPEPKPAHYYSKLALEECEKPGLDRARIPHFWLLLAAFVGLQYVVVTAESIWWVAACTVPLGFILI